MEKFDITKTSTALARVRETGEAVCLYVGFDIQAAIKACEDADPAKYDQAIVNRKPLPFKRRGFIPAPSPEPTSETAQGADTGSSEASVSTPATADKTQPAKPARTRKQS